MLPVPGAGISANTWRASRLCPLGFPLPDPAVAMLFPRGLQPAHVVGPASPGLAGEVHHNSTWAGVRCRLTIAGLRCTHLTPGPRQTWPAETGALGGRHVPGRDAATEPCAAQTRPIKMESLGGIEDNSATNLVFYEACVANFMYL